MRSAFTGALIINLILATLACNPPERAETSQPIITAQSVLSATKGYMSSVQSLEFELIHGHGSTAIMPGITTTEIHGSTIFPDKAQFLIRALSSDFGIALDMEVIIDGPNSYITNPISGTWEPMGILSLPIQFTKLRTAIISLIETIESPELVSISGTDGATLTRITGKVSLSTLKPLIPVAKDSGLVDVIMDINSDGAIQKLTLTGAIMPNDDHNVIRIIGFTDFDSQVAIVAPSQK